jgi:hypothetical protein
MEACVLALALTQRAISAEPAGDQAAFAAVAGPGFDARSRST